MTTSPESVLAQMKRPIHWTGWVPTLTQGGFRPFDPQIEDVRPDDIIHGLAGTFRYGGNTNPRITVAEHVVHVSLIIEEMWGPDYAAAGLLHDSCEAYLHDIQAPIRGMINVTLPSGEVIRWTEAERRINEVVFTAFGIDPAMLDAPEVKAADVLASCFEKRDIRTLKGDEDWGLPPIPRAIHHWTVRCLNPAEAQDALRLRWMDLGLPT